MGSPASHRPEIHARVAVFRHTLSNPFLHPSVEGSHRSRRNEERRRYENFRNQHSGVVQGRFQSSNRVRAVNDSIRKETHEQNVQTHRKKSLASSALCLFGIRQSQCKQGVRRRVVQRMATDRDTDDFDGRRLVGQRSRAAAWTPRIPLGRGRPGNARPKRASDDARFRRESQLGVGRPGKDKHMRKGFHW